MWSNPLASMKAANTYDTGRIAHLPFQTKKDNPTNRTTAKISNDSQRLKVKVGSSINGCLSRIARTAGLYTPKKFVKASSKIWTASAAHKAIQASQWRPRMLLSGEVFNRC